jgi:hypothetical protein
MQLRGPRGRFQVQLINLRPFSGISERFESFSSAIGKSETVSWCKQEVPGHFRMQSRDPKPFPEAIERSVRMQLSGPRPFSNTIQSPRPFADAIARSEAVFEYN